MTNKNNTPSDSQSPTEFKEEKAPQHVQDFGKLLIEHDAAVKSGDKKRMKELEQEIHNFAANQNLTDDQTEDLKFFVKQQIAGKVVNDERGKVHQGVTRVAHGTVRFIGLIADTFPPLCQQTMRLALSAVGLGLVGVAQAIKTTWLATKRVIFGQAS